MNVNCPTCGALVEFRYDDSFVRVCDSCRSAVVRTDRGPETLGKFADLAPVSSALRLFAEGNHGGTGFLLVGMAQLKHSAGGMWQEWYAKIDGGRWAWISEAQGRLYLTMEHPEAIAPPVRGMTPGDPVVLAGTTYTVAELGQATYVSALGEIPYRLVPNSTYWFVDLSDGRGGFATIDYGDGSERPVAYLGYQVTPQGLGLSGGEAPQVAASAHGARLACPNCNGSLELRVPDQTLRVACPYCESLVSVEGGALSIIARQRDKPMLAIALGAKAALPEGEMTVIGYLRRSAQIDNRWWPFDEYLLYAPGIGYRWLVCSDEHWSYVQPVATGAVEVSNQPSYDGVAFKLYQTAQLRVDRVVGECYWRVEIGEQVHAEDYIAPPAMLSREYSKTEQNWSLSSYMTPHQVNAAFGNKLMLSPPVGVAPNQPRAAGLGKVMAVSIAAVCAIGIAKCASSPAKEKLHAQFNLPAAGKTSSVIDPTVGLVPSSPSNDPATSAAAVGGDPAATVMFSSPFKLDGGKNIACDLSADVNNNWVYAAIDLVNDDTGAVVSFDKSIEYYSGSDSDGSWTEGAKSEREVIGPVPAGDYVLRVEAQHGSTRAIDLDIVVRQGVFRWLWLAVALGVLIVPFVLIGLSVRSFERRRWENSNLRVHGGDDD